MILARALVEYSRQYCGAGFGIRISGFGSLGLSSMAAADFYYAINATFRYMASRYGREGLYAYWRSLGREYFADLVERFRTGGLAAVEDYWREFFRVEPGGEVSVCREDGQVVIEVQECPAIRHLKANGREVMGLYCEHCLVINSEMADGAGLEFRMSGGDGACRQVFANKQ